MEPYTGRSWGKAVEMELAGPGSPERWHPLCFLTLSLRCPAWHRTSTPGGSVTLPVLGQGRKALL